MKTMQTMKTMKGGIGVLALLLAASLLLLLLPGCQAPTSPQADRPGTVSLTIGQLDMGRAIQPDIDLSGFTGGFTAVFARAGHDSVTVNIPAGGTTAQVELPQGEWDLTVNALIGTTVAATYSRPELSVGPGFTGVTATLSPIFTGGNGTFSWALTVPDGTTGNLEVRNLDEHGGIVLYPLRDTADFDVSINPTLWGANLPLPAGAYFVRFVLDHDTYGRAILSSDLHVYQGMTSSITRTLTDAHFRLGIGDTVIYSAVVTVTAPAFGAVPNTEATVGADANFIAGAVTWNPDHSPFRGGTAYTATVMLTAEMGYTFTGGLTTATINGQTATVSNNTGLTATLYFTFPATGPDPVIAAWEFTGNTSVNNAIVGPGNITVLPSGGQQQDDALLKFLTQSGSELTPRVLIGASSGINVRNAANTANDSELNDLANNAWWQTVISTAGRTDIAVTWRMRSTATAPRDWRLQYRVGATGVWNNVGGAIALSLPTTPANTINEPERGRFLPASAEGHDSLYLRWLMTSNNSVNPALNDGLVVAGGTHQINNLVIFSDANPGDFDNQDDQTGAFTVTWTGFSNPLLADGVTITGNAAAGAISINDPNNVIVTGSIQWLDGNMQPLGSTATLSLPSADFPPLVTVRVRTAGSSRTYSIVFDTATGAVF